MPKQGKSANMEMIGATAAVIDAKNPSVVGMTGIVIDETRNTIILQDGENTRRLVKDQITITINGKPVQKSISGRIEERIKG